MTWKDEVLLLWIFCSVLIAIVARHFGGTLHLLQHIAAFNVACVPGLLRLMVGRFR